MEAHTKTMSDTEELETARARLLELSIGKDAEQIINQWRERDGAGFRDVSLGHLQSRIQAAIDGYKSELEAAHAILDADESKIIRNAKDGVPEGREPRALTLAERVSALCRYAADYKRWLGEKKSELETVQGELAKMRDEEEHYEQRIAAFKVNRDIDQREYARLALKESNAVAALTTLRADAGKLAEVVEDYAKRCPNCGGAGSYVFHGAMASAAEQVQCQWCDSALTALSDWHSKHQTEAGE